jgi:hypothetical protein
MKNIFPPAPTEMGFSPTPRRSEKTTYNGRRSSNAGNLKPTVAGGHWSSIFLEFSASESKWAELCNLSRSVTSNAPDLFRRPARSMRGYSRRKRAPVVSSAAPGNERTNRATCGGFLWWPFRTDRRRTIGCRPAAEAGQHGSAPDVAAFVSLS